MKKIKPRYFLFIIYLITVYILCSALKAEQYSNLIYDGVKIQGIDLSGKTREEASDILNESYINRINSKKINVYSEKNKKTYTLDYGSLHIRFNTSDCLDQAYHYGKSGNFFDKIFKVNFSSYNCNLYFNYNRKAVEDFSAYILKAETKQPVNASIMAADDKLTVSKEQEGYMPDPALLSELLQNIQGKDMTDKNINLGFTPLIPKITSDVLAGVNVKIGTFSTVYWNISSPERCNNIELAVKSINGNVIMPGEVFSYNVTVGERTAARGYKYAPVIENGKMAYGLGGGICQVSTTLFNAAWKGGLDIVERNHHSLPVHYISNGMDATVDFGTLDLKIKNNRKYPVYIQGLTLDGKIVFNLYSNNT